jgi:hypothetical protein
MLIGRRRQKIFMGFYRLFLQIMFGIVIMWLWKERLFFSKSKITHNKGSRT